MEEIKKYHDNGNLRDHYFINENKTFHGIYRTFEKRELNVLNSEAWFNNGKFQGIIKFCYGKKIEMVGIYKNVKESENTNSGAYHGVKIEFNY